MVHKAESGTASQNEGKISLCIECYVLNTNTVFSVNSFFALFRGVPVLTDKRGKPLGFSSGIPVFHSQLIRGLAVSTIRTGLPYERSQPFLNGSLVSVIHSQLVRGFSILAIFTGIALDTLLALRPRRTLGGAGCQE